ncbi:NuA4 histone acetyltransferase subunit [Tilletia horrida]|uniref:NuA4 histone acetyltransferase subunit n=1 Tax=Tilletia horrida TaxID=155126 RepID=A0AAN6GY81_9BASI|nr:NuA4 histone acetyltransferase subunit [Tilletia horrida]KAK0557496.1 NuA4 histone acetyltransferase subunit [Tilletia horrida]KAK0567887.1 NuA4 histone acetyltransferase subunit [Tilletia horrida]
MAATAGVFGGDEISAIALDLGCASFRVGWAGEDTPRAILPAVVASSSSSSSTNGQDAEGDTSMADADPTSAGARKKRKRFVGDDASAIFRPDTALESIMDPSTSLLSANPSASSTMEAFTDLAEHALTSILSADPTQHPLIFTEPSHNSRDARESLTEIVFEQLQTPAYYLANQTVLSAFASGKGTALILDIGASHATASPVLDGFVLRKGIHRQPIGGTAITRALQWSISQPTALPSSARLSHTAIDIIPPYLIKSKATVEPGQPPSYILREDRLKSSHPSFRSYHDFRTLTDFKEAVVQVLDQAPWNESFALTRPTRAYEFPTGFSDNFGIERFRAPEVLFTPSLWEGCTLADGTPVLPPLAAQGAQAPRPYCSTTQLVLDAINAADVDLHPALASNIVLVGGASCTSGLVDRLSYELGVGAAGQKTKLHAPGNPIERRYSSWLGASILASLGTFHQLWISRTEYEEHGVNIVHARCK